MTWIAAKLFFGKAWVWIKTYWYVPAVLIYTVVLWVLFRRNGAAALEVLKTSKESYEAQIKAMEEAVGRATEMGKPVLFVPGILDFNEVETIAGINVLGHVSKLTAEYETELNVPVSKSIVMEAAREICKDSYLQAGRPDLYNNDMVYFLADSHDQDQPDGFA